MRIRPLVALLLALLVPAAATAQPGPPDVQFDTLYTIPAGPGVVYTAIHAPRVPWTLDVLEVDLTHPALRVQTAKAHELLNGPRETTSSMAQRHDRPGHRVVGAVNGDFFVGGSPVSIQVKDGEIIRGPLANRPAVGFDAQNRFAMVFPKLALSVQLPDTSLTLAGVNTGRGTNQGVLYNAYFGATTGTNAFGTEVRLRPLEAWRANDTLRLVVEAVATGEGGMAIPAGSAVLSGHGTAGALLQARLSPGDTLRAYLGLPPGPARLKEMIGGGPSLVVNGTSDVGPRGDGVDRHPRTAVGFSADSTRMYLITVDGRQATSAGMTLPELAYFMTRIGVHTGMNLDGGGSTTMVVDHRIVNDPSDSGVERPVANALIVASTAPVLGTPERIHVFPETSSRLFMNTSARYRVQGTDANGYPTALDGSRLTLRLSHALGTLGADGTFTAGFEADTGYVHAAYRLADGRTAVDSARVIVTSVARVELTPAVVATDTTRSVAFNLHAFDQDGMAQPVDPTWFTWTSTQPDVGTVDAQGRFRGRQPGTTQVIAARGAAADTATVTVDPQQGTALLAAMETLEGWALSGTNIDLTATRLTLTDSLHSQGNAALRLDYAFTYDPTGLNEIHLETDRLISGVPDSLFMDVRSDGKRHRIFYDVEDVEGRPFQLYAAAYADSEDRFATLPSAFARAIPRSSTPTMYHPLRLKRIVVRLASDRVAGRRHEGTLFLDNLRVTYGPQATDVATDVPLPGGVVLHGNYPNPFHGHTTITYELTQPATVTLTVYDVLGRTLGTLVEAPQAAGRHTAVFPAEGLATGLYFYRLEVGDVVRTGRMVLLR